MLHIHVDREEPFIKAFLLESDVGHTLGGKHMVLNSLCPIPTALELAQIWKKRCM